MFRQFIVRHYKILFRSKFLDGFVFLLLFLTGLARYRFSLVFIVVGLFSAINQYYLDQGRQTQLTTYYEILKRGFIPAVLVGLLFDINYGQIFPIYPAIPIWLTILAIVVGYAFSLVLYIKAAYLLQWVSKNAVFVVCPKCSFENIKVVEKCGNCGYTSKIPIDKVVHQTHEEIPAELKNEIDLYKNIGLYQEVPNEVIQGLDLTGGEFILAAAKSPNIFYFLGVNKNGERMRPGWFILTNKRVVCYYGWIGWTGKDIIPFEQISGFGIVKDRIPMKEEQFLEIKTKTDSYRFLFGATTKKLIRRIMLLEADNKLILESVSKSIRKRLSDSPQAPATNTI